jgi:hypothetical protein
MVEVDPMVEVYMSFELIYTMGWTMGSRSRSSRSDPSGVVFNTPQFFGIYAIKCVTCHTPCPVDTFLLPTLTGLQQKGLGLGLSKFFYFSGKTKIAELVFD